MKIRLQYDAGKSAALAGLVLAGLMLAGCGPKPFHAMSYAEVKQKAAEIAATCEAAGAHYPSKAFDQCMQHEIRKHDYDARQARQDQLILGATMQNAMGAMGDSYIRQSEIPIR